MSFRVACDAPGCNAMVDPGADEYRVPKGWMSLADDEEHRLHFCPKHGVKTKPRPTPRRRAWGYRRRRR
jgi:hypothetical protein